MIDFKGHCFEKNIILVCVRWYLAYPLSYRRLDVYLDPKLFKRLRPFLRAYGGETHPGYALVQLLDEWTPE